MMEPSMPIPGDLIVSLKVSGSCYYCLGEMGFIRTAYRSFDDDLEVTDELITCEKGPHAGMPPRFMRINDKEWTYGSVTE